MIDCAPPSGWCPTTSTDQDFRGSSPTRVNRWLQRAWQRSANRLRLDLSRFTVETTMGRMRGGESRNRLLRRRAVPWLISFAILTLFTTRAAAETKHVLMLFSNDSLLPAGNALGSSFQRTLEAENPDRVEIFTEFLDADRFPGPAHEARIASLLRAKYASIPTDLAIAIGPQGSGVPEPAPRVSVSRDTHNLCRHQ